MASIDGNKMIKNLEDAFNIYMDSVSQIEDSENLEQDIKKQASSIIQKGQIHCEIALEQIQS
jgi:hypothetical protein